MSKATNRQVEAFRAVMLTGSMTSAAELLGVTQPAVSRMISDFEAIAKLSLFERRPNHIVPTADAVALYGEVERSFVGLNRILDYARTLNTQTAGEVSIAAMPAFATEVLPRFVGRFLNSRPDARVRMEAFSSVSVVEAVASGEVDIGYTMVSPDRPGFDVTPLGGTAVVVMPDSHRLSSKLEVVAEDLNGENVIGSYGSIFQSRVELALVSVARLSRVETTFSRRLRNGVRRSRTDHSRPLYGRNVQRPGCYFEAVPAGDTYRICADYPGQTKTGPARQDLRERISYLSRYHP